MTQLALHTPGLSDLKFPTAHDPFSLYEQMRGEGPVYDARSACWLLTNYEHVVAVLSNPHFSSQRPFTSPPPASKLMEEVQTLLKQQLLVIDGSEHTRLQRLIGPAVQTRIYTIRQALAEQVEQLLATVQSLRQWDVVRDLARPLSLWSMAQILGIPVGNAAHLAQLAQWSDALAFATSGFVSLQAFEQMLTMKKAFAHWLAEKRVCAPEDDLLSMFANQIEWRDEEERIANAMMLFTAGNVTTIKGTTHGVWILLRDPEAAQELRVALQQVQGDACKQVSIVKPAVEQLLARVTPTRYIVRWATSDVELDGSIIRAGEQVYLFLEGANRQLFAAEDGATGATMDLCQRLARPHVTFGVAGNPHYCIGAPLARMSIQYALISILLRFPTLRLDPGATPEWGNNANLGGLASLPVLHAHEKVSQDQEGQI